MLSYEFSVNIVIMTFLLLASGIIGYALRSRQLRKKQMKIIELHREMTDNHAHILELQKEYVALEARIAGPKAPVRGMRNTAKDYESKDLEVLDSAI